MQHPAVASIWHLERQGLISQTQLINFFTDAPTHGYNLTPEVDKNVFHINLVNSISRAAGIERSVYGTSDPIMAQQIALALGSKVSIKIDDSSYLDAALWQKYFPSEFARFNQEKHDSKFWAEKMAPEIKKCNLLAAMLK